MHSTPTPHSGISPKLAFSRCTMMLLFFMLVLQSDILAQITDQPMMSKVYLENKSVFYGEILSWDEKGVMVLQTSKGIILTIPSTTIKRVVQNNPLTYANEDFSRPQRWYGGGALGLGFNANSVLLIAEIHGGYAWHRMLHFGLMTGVHHYFDNVDDQFIPAQLEWRGYWNNRSFSPYSVARLGTSFGLYAEDRNEWSWEERTYRPRLMIELLTGLRFDHSGSSHFALEAGYLRHAVSYQSYWNSNWGQGDKLEVRKIYQRWVFRLVIGF